MTDFTERNNDLEDWLKYGVQQGWIAPNISCNTHDGVIMTAEENKEFEEGSDPCIHVIRIFESEKEQKKAIRHNGLE